MEILVEISFDGDSCYSFYIFCNYLRGCFVWYASDQVVFVSTI